MDEVFIELITIMLLGVGISVLMQLLKQPLIIGYILTGILASPYFLNIVGSHDAISAFAEIGVVLLLFLVGLNLNPKVIKDVGKVSIIAGASQIILTAVIIFGIMFLLDFGVLTSIYVSLALAFSSTIIIMKFLTDKRDVTTLYGKISIGLLIVQDIVAMFVLMLMTSLNKGGDIGYILIETLLKGASLIVILVLVSVYILPKLTTWIAKSQEFLMIFSIGWCLALAGAFYGMNFSMEVGALLAGVSLGVSPYRHEISSRLRPLRDFFLVMFFILLGSQMVFKSVSVYLLPIVLLTLFTLLIKPFIVILLLSWMGYSKRTSFFSGMTMAQISEFSFIIIALGLKIGQVSDEILSMVTIVGLISIAGSSYMMKYSHKIYPLFSKKLSLIERKGKKMDEHGVDASQTYDVILFGYNRIGHDILESLKKMENKFLIVDYNPDTIKELSNLGIACKYGDANDLELLNDLDLKNVKMVISTVPDVDTNLLLVDKMNSSNEKAITILVSHQVDESLRLYEAGATYVIMPYFLGGKHASMMLEKYGINLERFLKERIFHVENLRNRKKFTHEESSSRNQSDYRA